MAKISGVGGIFFEADDQDDTFSWFTQNLGLDDLDAMLKELEAKGVTIVKRFDPEPNGKLAHIAGPNDLTVELWEPADPDPYDP